MKPAPLPPNEAERLRALHGLRVLDTETDETLDRLVELAAEICGTPMAVLSLVDADRQWFKAKTGIAAKETSRNVAFCAHAILQPEIFVVADAADDERFHDNPLVLSDPKIRFYAGLPLETEPGIRLGALCVIDRVPRALNERQINALRILRDQVVGTFRRRLAEAERETERDIAAALARVGEVLIAGLGNPNLIEHLCQATREVTRTDFSYMIRHDRTKNVYSVVAGSERNPADLGPVAAASLPHSLVAEEVSRIKQGELVEIDTTRSETPLEQLDQALGITRVLHAGVRRGPDLYGILTAGQRRPGMTFDDKQRRILTGVAQLGALALETASREEELEEATEVQSYFASILSHELRGTFAVVSGVAEMLTDLAPQLPEEARELVDMLARRAEEGRDVIEATLELTRSGHGQRDRWQPVALADFVADLERSAPLPSESSDLKLVWRIQEGMTLLQADPIKVKMIVRNLVGNAARFTERGEITVSFSEEADITVISVSDTGIGIPRDRLKQLFQPFQQAHGMKSRQAGGFGLGLFIVRGLIQDLGGGLEVDSEEGRGTRFLIRLPKKPPPA